jgi:hypothetical protein
MFFKQVEKFLGPNFVASIKRHVASAFDIFGGIGDLIKAMWNGDSKGVMDALGTIGKGLIDGIVSTLDMAANAILKIGPLILEYVMKALEMVSSKIGDIFLSLKEIYLIGPVFELIGQVFKFLGKIFNAAGEGWKLIGEFFKNIWVSFEELPGKIRSWGAGIVQAITSPFTEGWNKVKEIFGDGVKKVKDILGIRSPSKVFQAIGEDMADGVDQSLQKVPENAEKTFKKTAATAADATEALKKATPPATAAVTPNTVTPEQVENTGKLMQAVMSLAGKIPVDASIKGKLEQMNDILETLGKITSVLGDIKGGSGDLGALNKNMHFIFNILQTLNGELRTAEEWSPGLKDITDQFEKMGVSKLSSENAVAVGTLLENLNKITTSISNASSSVVLRDQESPIQAVGRQLNFVHNILKLLNGQDVDQMKGVSLSSLTSLIDSLTVSAASLGKAESIVKISQKLTDLSTAMSTIPDNMNTVKDAFAKMSGNSMKLQTDGMIENIKAVQEMVAKTRELDDALSKMPQLKFPAKLDTIANGMGIGGKFAYTVQSKEVVINVAFEVSMDVDKVEKVIITRQQSVIRDRLNYIMDNTMKGNTNTANAMIKKQGEQAGNVSTNQP